MYNKHEIRSKGILDMKPIKQTITAKSLKTCIYTEDFKNEYISLTDIAKYKVTIQMMLGSFVLLAWFVFKPFYWL